MTEFLIAAPVLLLLGLGTIQMVLIYNAKTTVNYATFEAARTGAVNHAQLDPMREELGLRLAPLLGGDGTAEKAAAAIVASKAHTLDPIRTRIEIINPTLEAFTDWGRFNEAAGKTAIPNAHLLHKDAMEIGQASGLNLHDANILKVAVTHGVKMNIPIIAPLLVSSLSRVDPHNSEFYSRSLFPVTSVATVRMQSDAWQNEAMISVVATPGGTGDSAFVDMADSMMPLPDSINEQDCDSNHGLPKDMPLLTGEEIATGMCIVADLSYGEPGSSSALTVEHQAGCS
ncbi:MAG: pilus assembly protein [Gammaproteobacteria bacterium]|nr:pilus assembly protein [Gammaproteobacteria bacterium]